MNIGVDEFPLLFLNTPASLKTLSSSNVAVIIWRSNFNANSIGLKTLVDQNHIHQRVQYPIHVPKKINDIIQQKIVTVSSEIVQWITANLENDVIFKSGFKHALPRCIKHIAVNFHGSICFTRTAINMLNSGEFTDAENFKMASTFCLIDHLKRLWPSVANCDVFDSQYEADKLNLIYWSGYLNQSAENRFDSTQIHNQIKGVLFRRNDVTAFSYFEYMLNQTQKESMLIELVMISVDHHAVIQLLSRLNRVSLEKVLASVAVEIFEIVIKNDYYLEHASQVWTIISPFVSEDGDKFCDLVAVMWKIIFFHYPHYEDSLVPDRYHEMNGVLIGIWSRATENAKSRILNHFMRQELFAFHRYPFKKYYAFDITMLIAMARNMETADKNAIWNENWHELALRSRLSHFNILMRLCLHHNQAIEFANFRMLFTSLIDQGFYIELENYLAFCSRDVQQFQRLGKEVLKSNLYLILLHENEDFVKLKNFIVKLFPNMPNEEAEFKFNLISSTDSVKCFIAARQANRIGSEDFRKIVEKFVSNESEVQLVKRNLLSRSGIHPVDGKCQTPELYAHQWMEFMMWCWFDDDEPSAFKRSLDLDAIFHAHLKDHLDENRSGVLEFLDQFLKWYFVDDEKLKIFKADKIADYHGVDFLRVKLESNSRQDRRQMYRTLKWFFGNDMNDVREFYAMNNFTPPNRWISQCCDLI